MKNIVIATALAALPVTSFSAETDSKIPVSSEFQTLSMEGLQTQEQKKPTAHLKVSMTCTDVTGRVLNQGDAGYEGCLTQVKMANQHSQGSAAPGNPSMNQNQQMNMNLKFGN